MDMTKLFGLAAASALAMGLSVTAASAVTTVNDGDTVNFGDLEFKGVIQSGAGGAGTWTVNFEADNDGAGEALVTIGPINASAWDDLMVSWSAGESSSVGAGDTTVSTVFMNPATLSQMLVVSWGAGTESGAGFDIEGTVSAIPLPAAGLLLLGGLGALGFAGRRKVNA